MLDVCFPQKQKTMQLNEEMVQAELAQLSKSEAEGLLGCRIPPEDFHWNAFLRFSNPNTRSALETKLRHLQTNQISQLAAGCDAMRSHDAKVVSKAICAFLNTLTSRTVTRVFESVTTAKSQDLGPGIIVKGKHELSELWNALLPDNTYDIRFVCVSERECYHVTQFGFRELLRHMKHNAYALFLREAFDVTVLRAIVLDYL